MFKEQYNQLHKQIQPDPNLIQTTINEALKHERKYNNKAYSIRKPILAFISICLCFVLAIPALAATVKPIYQLMYMVSPTVAQFFIPVQKSNEDNGIKMEVLSAYIHDNVAEIYITMQDLTEDRIDETTDLFDSYNINRPFDSSAYCERVGYDKNTKTATFLITIEEWGDKNISGDKITFTVREFISKKTSSENNEINLSLANYAIPAEYQMQNIVGASSKDTLDFSDKGKFLIPQSTIQRVADNIDISAIGFIDGKLHIQMKVENKLSLDPHGFFYLIDSQSNRVDYQSSITYRENTTSENAVFYDEFIFDVSKENLSDYKLYGSFYTAGLNTKGDWRVTFPLKNTTE